MSRHTVAYAYRARCPHCKGPLFYLEQDRRYYCANQGCGDHGAGRILTDDEVEHDEPVMA